jgi:hypothetical protein
MHTLRAQTTCTRASYVRQGNRTRSVTIAREHVDRGEAPGLRERERVSERAGEAVDGGTQREASAGVSGLSMLIRNTDYPGTVAFV